MTEPPLFAVCHHHKLHMNDQLPYKPLNEAAKLHWSCSSGQTSEASTQSEAVVFLTHAPERQLQAAISIYSRTVSVAGQASVLRVTCRKSIPGFVRLPRQIAAICLSHKSQWGRKINIFIWQSQNKTITRAAAPSVSDRTPRLHPPENPGKFIFQLFLFPSSGGAKRGHTWDIDGQPRMSSV